MLAVVDVCGGIQGMSGWFVSTVCTCFYFFKISITYHYFQLCVFVTCLFSIG